MKNVIKNYMSLVKKKKFLQTRIDDILKSKGFTLKDVVGNPE